MKQMKNSKYWQKRFEQIEDSSNKVASKVAFDTEKMFQQAEKEIEQEISVWYQRFATNNGMTLADAKKFLKDNDLKEFKWNVQEYIKYGEENSLNKQWIKELENASAKYHISRLEALKLQTRQTIEALYNNEEKIVNTMVQRVYSDGYYHSMYEIQRGFNIGWDIGTIDQKKLQRIISKPWATDGKNFSDRIWQSKNQLIEGLHTELTRTCILGKSPDAAIKNISKKFNTSKSQAGRLIMTEQAYFSSVAQQDVFNDLDVEKYEIVATLDNRTSDVCSSMDGEVFEMKDYEPGVTAPPFHPNCRTTTVPYFDDQFDIGERAAKDENGKTYYVPANMKYNDWKNSFVEENNKTNLKEIELSENSAKINNEWNDFTSLSEAQKYVSDNYAASSDISKIKNLESINMTCKTLDDLQKQFPLEKQIYIKNEIGSKMRKANAKGSYRGIIINSKVFNSADSTGVVGKDWLAFCENEIKRLEPYVGDLKYKQKPILNRIQEAKMWKDYNCFSISSAYGGLDSIKATVSHEYGHIVADQYFGQINKKYANPLFEYNDNNKLYQKCKMVRDVYNKAWKTDDIIKLSAYASQDECEFFAEVFSKKYMGEELPDYIDEMLERVLKQ